METFTPIKIDEKTPLRKSANTDGQVWYVFTYAADDEVPPYKWAKYISNGTVVLKWMSWNSDRMEVNYKQIPELPDTFYPVKKR